MTSTLELSPSSDPTLALRWLVRARRGCLAIQLLLMLAAEAGTDLHLHSAALVGLLSAWVVVDLAEDVWKRRADLPGWLVPAHGVVDLAALTGVLALSGGPRNPLAAGYVVYLAVLAMVLPTRGAWAMAGLAMVLQGLVVLRPGHLPGMVAEVLPTGHLVGHIAAFDLSALAVTWLVNRLSLALRAKEAAEREAQRRRETTDRLAALGTLAAGISHELGTPLATIQLLVEEARREAPDPERISSLLTAVDRCRSILDRLRRTDGSGPEQCVADVQGWAAEWQLTAGNITIELPNPPLKAIISGSESNWRAAVWVILDNSRRAGAQRVQIEAIHERDRIELRICDTGHGLDAEKASHAGEPFRTGWGGTGLGLFVSRTFARSVGGDVSLESVAGGGAIATLHMPKVLE